MNMRKIRFITTMIIVLFLYACLFLSAFAEDSGLLITLRSDTHNKGEAVNQGLKPAMSHYYRTLWIHPDGNSLKAIEGDGIIVPRDDGFWKVYTKRITVRRWTEDLLYALPGKKNPPKPKVSEYTEETGGFRDVGILFVGNNYISTEFNSEGYSKGAAHPFHINGLTVFSFKNLTKAVNISQILGKGANEKLLKDSLRYLQAHPNDKDKLTDEGSPDSWGLVRRNGAWVLRGFIDYSCEAARGNFAHYDINMTPPPSLVSHDKLTPSWQTIKRNIPTTIDAFSSPDGSLLGVMTPKQLLLYRVKGNVDFTNPTLKIAMRELEFPVMIQWATGGYVKVWTEKIKTIVGIP